MGNDLKINQIAIPQNVLKELNPRDRNQIIGCMHAHNELSVLNRMLLFSMNRTGEGQLHDSAMSVQTWCFLQILVGKLFETWKLIEKRFLLSNPVDKAVKLLDDKPNECLIKLTNYFHKDHIKKKSLCIIRDKTAFHYDQVNLERAIENLDTEEGKIYISQHPANSLYYVGSALVFRTIFAMVADSSQNTENLTHRQRTHEGFRILIDDTKDVNFQMHTLLYGLIKTLLDIKFKNHLAKPECVIIVSNALTQDKISLPTFVNI